MSNHDQCPSTTKGEKRQATKAELARVARHAGTVNGAPVWRSAEDLADTREFRDWIEREFPAGASELSRAEGEDDGSGESRRGFLKLMGASLALAGAASIPGCRQPDHKIMPYSRTVPEDIIPGKPLFYATSFPRPDGGAEGLLVETHEGRPTKIEGNPLHPVNNGKVSTWALASIMSLYDPDRLKNPVYKNPVRGQVSATWDDFRAWAKEHLAGYAANGGEGLAFVVGRAASLTRRAACASLAAKFPKATWVDYSATEDRASVLGTKIAFGRAMREVLNISKANTRVIVSLDRDFLTRERGELTNARGFAKSREVLEKNDSMSRLYAVESGFSITGGQADHRLALAPSRVAAFAVELAKRILPASGSPAGAEGLAGAIASMSVPAGEDLSGHSQTFLAECAKDLMEPNNRGKTLLVAGATQPPEVHALVAAMNAALGNVGVSVSYKALGADEAADSRAGIAGLASAIKSGAVRTVVCVGANPVYDAPGETGFAEAFAKAESVTLSVEMTETAMASTWMLNAATYLESWGDTVADDGTVAPVQPMIAPLYEPALSELEFLTLLAKDDAGAKVDGYDIVREHWRTTFNQSAADFEKSWRRILHDGVVPNSARAAETPKADYAAIGAALAGLKIGAAPTKESLEAAFVVGHLHDGRYANVGWLQELPETGTRVVWDNPVLMSPKTAEALGVSPAGWSRDDDMSGIYTKPKYPTARVIEMALGGRTIKAAAWILPGMPDNTLLCTLGYGREHAGRVGDGVGFNMYGVLPASGARAVGGVKVTKTDGEHMIASTQNHWSMNDRASIVRGVDLPAWNKHADHVQKAVDTFYANQDKVKELNFAESLGELGHTPPNLSLYSNPFNRTPADPDPKAMKPGNPQGPAYQKNTGPEFASRPQWAMTIDQTTCNGCGNCTIACQAENNIPVVGKKEVAKGREMTWIRVDRYFTGDMDKPEAMLHQPVACVHCENAPCEVVCPVNATVHGPEGLNYMTYNRCIGTRYCANNCPYKVRRFNFFDYGVTKFNGDYYFKEFLDDAGGAVPGQEGITGSGAYNKLNPNLIPPRLRQKLDQISRMQKNPDVTVRSRGVMEKCTYCVQRINAARIDTKLQGMDHIPEGYFQSACQQACPSDAITFGDSLDESSRVRKTREHARSYSLLGYLNTRPRTSHMVRVMNPNPALCSAERKASWEDPFHHGGGHEGGQDEHAKPDGHAFRFDGQKKREDRGYALSLNVLSRSHA
ncbi:Menaquinone reductase, iron-sulfur cluster-binding subunit [Phycisphaerales bacterium]|nr:Menaquinone reductase, iron-sulfur cluster-binding subunit [Phycisphaerales bacterium]